MGISSTTFTMWLFVYFVQIELEFRNVGFRGEEKNRSTRRKTSRSKDENQQQTQPTSDAEYGNRTRVTLMGDECSPSLLPKRFGATDHYNTDHYTTRRTDWLTWSFFLCSSAFSISKGPCQRSSWHDAPYLAKAFSYDWKSVKFLKLS